MANAVPIALRSEHREPVGIDTSQLIPRKYWNCFLVVDAKEEDVEEEDEDDDIGVRSLGVLTVLFSGEGGSSSTINTDKTGLRVFRSQN